MTPSRRVLLLTIVAVACGALIVVVALVGLATPRRGLTELDQRVLTASTELDHARSESRGAQALFIAALTSTPDQRAAVIADSQLAGSRSSAHWHEYLRRSFNLPGERKLQHRYDHLNHETEAAGASVFVLIAAPGSDAYTTALGHESALSEQLTQAIEQINQRFYQPRITGAVKDAEHSLSSTRLWILIVFGVVLAGGLVNAIVLFRGAKHEERELAQREVERRRNERRSNLETELQRGLEMEPTEESTYSVIGSALAIVRPREPVELLVADSSRAHFRQVLSTDAERQGPGCPVISPAECPAAASGQARLFLSSSRLDACPFLRNREGEPHSAACVPMSIAGTTTAVIHTTGPDGQPPETDEMIELELVARKAGDRIGFLRVLARSETQARIDVLTGLFNRRSVEAQVRPVIERGAPFVVAFADLDHFKMLNDEHGHEMGDRALRLFARVLRDSVRPADIPARFGGEEFVVVLPDCQISDARIVGDRVRARLATALAASTVPAFTVSIGLAAWEPPEGFIDTVGRADAALLHAKRNGRDRVVAAVDIPAGDVTLGAEELLPAPEPVAAPLA